MLSISDIEKKAERLWPKLLRATLSGESLFPWTLSLGIPRGKELSDNFEKSLQYFQGIRAYAVKHGLNLEEGRLSDRRLGVQIVPQKLSVPCLDAYLAWREQGELFSLWQQEVQLTLKDLPNLTEWLLSNVLVVQDHLLEWPSIRSVLRRFSKGDIRGRFLRELDISGVDSKFIERHRSLLAELLPLVMEVDTYDSKIEATNPSNFCRKFGLRYDRSLIRFRCLDPQLLSETGGFEDLSVPLQDFSRWTTSAERVFFTENKSNGLSFPFCRRSLVVFGLGGAIDLLSEVHWLREKELFYWGDLDSYGFAILARFRRLFPHTRSILMDEDALHSARESWVKEKKQCPDVVEMVDLDNGEWKLYSFLREHSLRLEQERIPFDLVLTKLTMKEGKTC